MLPIKIVGFIVKKELTRVVMFLIFASMIEFEENTCFGCGQENPRGLQLKLKFDPDTRTAFGLFEANEELEGIPNIIHSGIVASVLDETMVTVNKYLDIVAMTSEITVRYLQPAFIHENLYIRGWHVKRNKQVVENRAEIENEMGKIVARAKGKYVEVDEIPQPE